MQMGNSESINTANFDDVRMSKGCSLIHVMDECEQIVMIKGTLSIEDEIDAINNILSKQMQTESVIIIYGKNTDAVPKLVKRYRQLRGLGFTNAFVYFGGLFEWLLLHDIYGISEFPIENLTNLKIDAMQYKPMKNINR